MGEDRAGFELPAVRYDHALFQADPRPSRLNSPSCLKTISNFPLRNEESLSSVGVAVFAMLGRELAGPAPCRE